MTKVAQILGDFLGYFYKHHILNHNCCGYFYWDFGLIFIPTAYHTAYLAFLQVSKFAWEFAVYA